jgi:pyroglutamyl-peptidase
MNETYQRRLLITGFGPFPGVPVNNSARLAEMLAGAGRARLPSHLVEASILPTEWTAGPDKLNWLWDTFRPDVAIHFGVSAETRGLQLEMTGRNQCRMDTDAAGLLPLALERRTDGPETCAATLPNARIVERLDEIGVQGSISKEAGAYLCNAILYDSVQRAAMARPAALAGFVHIPTELVETPSAAARSGLTGPLTWGAAVAGGLAILECALDELERLRSGGGTRSA